MSDTLTCISDYTGFGLVNTFIDQLQVVTINNYYNCWFLYYKSLRVFSVFFHQSLLVDNSPQWLLFLCNVFTRRFLVTNLSNGDSSVSVARSLTLHSWTLNRTAFARWTEHGRSSHIASERTHREHRLLHLFYCCVTSPRTRMLRVLHSHDCTRHVSGQLLYCCVWALPSNGWYLQSHLLATRLHATILSYVFREIVYCHGGSPGSLSYNPRS
jgi:hypothetical protein